MTYPTMLLFVATQNHFPLFNKRAKCKKQRGAENGTAAMVQIAWGKVLSSDFKDEVISISDYLTCDPSHLTSAMAFETGETFSPSIQNKQSGAIGLIQFMPKTAAALGTSTDELRQMTAVEQLVYVRKYLQSYRNRMKSLSDVYMTILWPKAVGQPEAYVIFKTPSKQYEQNKGLDANKDGQVTKGEAAYKVQLKLNRGLSKDLRG
jgi:hypothetical protein